MPVYDYKCKAHGVFHELATMADYDKPCACPQCGEMSARVIMIAPEFLNMDSERRKAFDTNEKAQHEPIFSTDQSRKVKKEDGGCGCGDHKKRNSKLMYTAQGEKFFPSMRPWMISH
jgi:putative FmdB family regulatory protein